MPLEPRDELYLGDMRAYALEVVRFMRGSTIDYFGPDSQLRRAVERSLEIVGEAAGRVSIPVQEEHPEIPWRQMVGLRNVLAHGYAAVDGVVLWEVASRDISELIAALERILPSAGGTP